ncbi:nucleotidyltransferase domain protein [Peptococcaceae bacterium CEB3]|nr:nucleotidyltransferase domain protein [Peptococcaceae bacterium CEB3]
MNEIRTVLNKVVTALMSISGIEAVVLGGSRARGTHYPESDIDIGIYYDADALDLSALQEAARTVDDERPENLIATPGEWGKWVNGGVKTSKGYYATSNAHDNVPFAGRSMNGMKMRP